MDRAPGEHNQWLYTHAAWLYIKLRTALVVCAIISGTLYASEVCCVVLVVITL
jgi:hypothetical protein